MSRPDLSSTDPPRGRRLALLAIIVVATLALDLLTKGWAWENLRNAPPMTLIEGFLYLEFGFNTGSAFSFLHDVSWARGLFIAVTFFALGYMGWLTATIPTRSPVGFVAAGLIVSGALGNLHDRIFRVMPVGDDLRHGVVDFIKFYYWPGKSWPTFNVADVVLVVGVGLLLLYVGRNDHLDESSAGRQIKGEQTPSS